MGMYEKCATWIRKSLAKNPNCQDTHYIKNGHVAKNPNCQDKKESLVKNPNCQDTHGSKTYCRLML